MVRRTTELVVTGKKKDKKCLFFWGIKHTQTTEQCPAVVLIAGGREMLCPGLPPSIYLSVSHPSCAETFRVIG